MNACVCMKWKKLLKLDCFSLGQKEGERNK